MLTPPLIGVHKNKNGVNETRNNKRRYKKRLLSCYGYIVCIFCPRKREGGIFTILISSSENYEFPIPKRVIHLVIL